MSQQRMDFEENSGQEEQLPPAGIYEASYGEYRDPLKRSDEQRSTEQHVSSKEATGTQRMALAIVSLIVLMIVAISMMSNPNIAPLMGLAALLIVTVAATLINYLFGKKM